MKISVITPTNGRPEALEICRHYVARQTKPAHQHIISEGGTLKDNLLEALDRVTGDVVAIFEDDDHYEPDWLEQISQCMGPAKMVGQLYINYYHLPSGGYKLMKSPHPSLCATAFCRSVVPRFVEACSAEMVDFAFWRGSARANVPARILTKPQGFVTGMKGLPGTRGMCQGHKPELYSAHDCADNLVLRKWVGDEDAGRYLGMHL